MYNEQQEYRQLPVQTILERERSSNQLQKYCQQEQNRQGIGRQIIFQNQLCQIIKRRNLFSDNKPTILKKIYKNKINQQSGLKTKVIQQIRAYNKAIYLNNQLRDQNQNSYIVNYSRTCQNDDYYVVQMEFCDSRTLKDEIIEDRVANYRSEYNVLYLLSIMYGLTRMHFLGIHMHRDLKPENIFVTHDLGMRKRLKLGDFGICSESNRSKKFEGTCFFYAPQVFAANNHWINYQYFRQHGYSASCDVYSLGVIMYMLFHAGRSQSLVYPYIQSIEQKIEMAKKSKKPRKQINELTRQYYQKCVDYQKSTLNFMEYEYTDHKNTVRTKYMKQLIRIMLHPEPQKRKLLYDIYIEIDKIKQELFAGLQGCEVVKQFQQWMEEERISQESLKYHNFNNSTNNSNEQ